MERIEQLINEWKSMEMVREHLNKVKWRLHNEKIRLKGLKLVLDKEYKDVEKLQKRPLKELFSRVLGDMTEKYELEKQEYLHAFLQYKECRDVVELLEFEEKILEQKLIRADDVKKALDLLINERAILFKKRYPGLYHSINAIHLQQDEQTKYNRELYEGLIVATKVKNGLLLMVEQLNSAKDEGHWGEFYHERQANRNEKNRRIDEAHRQAAKIKVLMQELEDELEDVYQYKKVRRYHKFDSFQHFNDIYYDRLISDWIVREKIENSLHWVKGTIDGVIQIIDTLKLQQQSTEKVLTYLAEKKETVIREGLIE